MSAISTGTGARLQKKLFRDRFETKSAGLFSGTLVSEELLLWADVVFVMDEDQKTEVEQRFPALYLKKKIISLDISNAYDYNSPELIDLLEQKMNKLNF